MQTDSELIQAVTSTNDHDAFAELVVRYEKLVWASVWVILADYHATQDVTQDTFLIAHSQLKQLRNHDSLGTWLCRIARREALRLPRWAVTNLPSHGVESPTVESSEFVTDAESELITALGSLPDHERVVITLRYINGHSLAEISDITEKPVGTVSKQISRALKRLRDLPGLRHSDKTASEHSKR